MERWEKRDQDLYTEVKRNEKIYQRTLDKQTVYLKNVVSNPNIEAGDYTMCNEIITEKYE